MGHRNYGHSHPTLIILHPSRLFSEGLASLLKDTPYEVVTISDLDDVDLAGKGHDSTLCFLVGGRSLQQIVETVRTIRAQSWSASIIVIGATGAPSGVMSAFKAGADCYLREAMTFKTLVSAIELVAQDEAIVPTEFVESLRRHSLLPAPVIEVNPTTVPEKAHVLSAREETILQALVDGAPNKVIANRLSIAEATVKVHVKAILRKIRVKNRTQAAIWAMKYMNSFEPGLTISHESSYCHLSRHN